MYNGGFFTGLDNDSTFTVQVKWAYEMFPGPNETPTVCMASPRPEPDFKAIEVYQSAARSAPSGWPVSANASGDAWRDIKSLLWSAVDAVASSDLPLISTVAKGARFARNVLNAVTDSTLKQKTSGTESKKKSAPLLESTGGGSKTYMMKGPPKRTTKKG